ncbi:heme o synthase [Rickettsiales bacterium LUAb2]
MNKFFSITKPGIVFGNLITTIAGFFLGIRYYHFDFILFISTLLGISLVVASGCVFNNCIDKDIDTIMERTTKRVLPSGLMSVNTALIYGSILGILGFLLLYWQTNVLTVFLAFIGFFVYVVIYSLWLKRKNTYGIVVGAVSGAIPPVVGYCAASNNFDLMAVILFILLFLWQMPHTYAINIYRQSDFTKANLPILPNIKGMLYTKKTILIYVVLFVIVSILPTIIGVTGKLYLLAALLLGITWIAMGVKGFSNQEDKIWARKMFLFSINILTILSIFMCF